MVFDKVLMSVLHNLKLTIVKLEIANLNEDKTNCGN